MIVKNIAEKDIDDGTNDKNELLFHFLTTLQKVIALAILSSSEIDRTWFSRYKPLHKAHSVALA